MATAATGKTVRLLRKRSAPGPAKRPAAPARPASPREGPEKAAGRVGFFCFGDIWGWVFFFVWFFFCSFFFIIFFCISHRQPTAGWCRFNPLPSCLPTVENRLQQSRCSTARYSHSYFPLTGAAENCCAFNFFKSITSGRQRTGG